MRIAGERRIGIDDLRLSEIVGARVERCTNANANQPALLSGFGLLFLPLVPTNELLAKVEHPWVVPRVVHATIRRGVGKFLWPDVIAQPHLIGGDAEFVRANIDHPLQEPQMLHTGIAAVRSDRAFIGHSLSEINAGIFEAIHPGENLRPDHATQRLVTGISATVINVPRGNGSDHVILIQRHSRVTEGALIAVGAGGHVLGACFHPFNRPSPSFL